MKNFHTQLLLEANSNLEVKVHQGAKLQIFSPLMEMQSFDLQEVRFDSYISIYQTRQLITAATYYYKDTSLPKTLKLKQREKVGLE